MKFKITSVTGLLLLLSYVTMAQHSITGTVISQKTKEPLEYATIVIYNSDSTLVRGNVTNDKGYFKIENVKTNTYSLEVRLVGFINIYKIINANEDLDLGTIELNEDNIELKEIEVKASTPSIQQKSDRLIVNLSSYMLTGGKSALDVIKSLPGVVVIDNKISVIGMNAIIYINGKPADFTGSSIDKILRTLQGNQIDRVELITNPSSRYDAGYLGAIIDLRLKRDETLGFNGTSTITLGLKESGTVYTPSASGNFRSQKLNMYGTYGLNNGKYRQRYHELKKYHNLNIPIEYDELGIYKPSGTSHYARFGIDYSISPKHVLGILANGSFYDGGNTNQSTTSIRQIGNSKIDSSIVSPINMTINSKMYSLNLNHKWVISEGKELSTDVVFSYADHVQEQKMIINYFDSIGDIMHPSAGNGHNVIQKTDVLALKTDYQSKLFKDGLFETGGQVMQVKRNNILVRLLWTGDKWDDNVGQSNNFIYNERIIAFYINLSKKWNKLNVSSGLRGEQTYQYGYQDINHSSFSNTYFDIFPSFSMKYMLKENQSLTFSYAYKIDRPSFSMLNPFKFYTSPNTYSSGNPDLKPSYNHNLQLRYNFKKYILTLAYSKYDALFIQEPFQDDENKQQYFTYENFGMANIFTVSLYIPVLISRWWTLNFNGNAYYREYSSRFMGDDYFNSYLNGNIRLSNQFSIGKGLKMQLNAFVTSTTWNIARRVNGVGSMDLSIEKILWDGKGNLSFSLEDPFIWNQSRSVLQYKNIDTKSHVIPDLRMVRINFTYNFGSDKVKQSRRRNTGIENIERRIQ